MTTLLQVRNTRGATKSTVTATVTNPGGRREAQAAVDMLAATARIRLRPVYGSQDAAFAACLPLGLVLSKHAKMPSELTEAM